MCHGCSLSASAGASRARAQLLAGSANETEEEKKERASLQLHCSCFVLCCAATLPVHISGLDSILLHAPGALRFQEKRSF